MSSCVPRSAEGGEQGEKGFIKQVKGQKLAPLKKGQKRLSPSRVKNHYSYPSMYISKSKDLSKSHFASKAQNCSLQVLLLEAPHLE